jgi:hypothetical protein
MSTRSWGTLFRTTPFSTRFGLDRGTAIDRVFIETFLSARAHLIRGQVLEVSENAYASRLRVDRDGSLDIVDMDPDNPDATIIADLCSPGSLPVRRYHCAIVTQTLQYLRHPTAAVRNLHDCLELGGSLLVTAPGITRIDPGDGRGADRWRVTPLGLRDILSVAFDPESIVCAGYGDLQTATAFLYGLSAEEIELAPGDERTSDFAVVVCAEARRR